MFISSLPPPRMDSVSNTVSQAVPAATAPSGNQASVVPSRPLPIPPPRTADLRLPQSLTPSQLNAIRDHLKLMKDSKSTPGHARGQRIRVPNQAICDAWTRPPGLDVKTYTVSRKIKTHNSLEPDMPVSDVVEQPLAEVAAPAQPVEEVEGAGAQAVDSEVILKSPQEPNTSA